MSAKGEGGWSLEAGGGVGAGAPLKDGWWGYDTMIVEDPDGNELFFPYP